MSQISSRSRRLFKSRLGSDRGQATIEFALVIIMLFLAVVSILELIIFVHTYNVLADSAKEGVRYAIVHGANNSYHVGPTCPCAKVDGPPASSGAAAEDPTNTYGVVKTYAQYSLHDTTSMTVTVTYPDAATPVKPSNATPNRVKVTVSYPYQWFLGLGWAAIQVNASAEGRIMN